MFTLKSQKAASRRYRLPFRPFEFTGSRGTHTANEPGK